MSGIMRDERHISDDDILSIIGTVEAHDFDRIEPPSQVWNNVLAEMEVAVAEEEATARRRTRRWFSTGQILSAAAVVVVLMGIALTLTLNQGEDTGRAVAMAVMTDEGLPISTEVTASADVICDESDNCYLDVDLTALPDAGDENLELWVINADVSDMHSLGLVDDSGRFQLPSGVTADDFPIVDISLEPDDGDPTHSGKSILRGVLEKT